MSDAPATSTRPLSRWWWLVIGVGSAVVGLLPWIITGLRLPLQNLWATSDVTAQPIALLPFSQYALTLIAALLVVGAAVAGLVARGLRSRLPAWGFAVALAGVLVVQSAALLQTSIVVAGGLRPGRDAELYLAALIGVSILAILIGVGVAALIATAPRAGAVIGLALAASALAPWLSGLIAPLGAPASDLQYLVVGFVRWVPPVLVGVAIAWGGLRTVGRVVAALGALAIVWIVPALMTGVGAAAGTRVLANDIPGMVQYAVQVFFAAATIPELALPPVVVAIVTAAIALGVRAVLARRTTA